jgi:MYXO-CTERM domain-containing protein
MGRNIRYGVGAAFVAALLVAGTANASPFTFSTNGPDGKMATATRPESATQFEIESADDFFAPGAVRINSATFTGLIPAGASVQSVVVEIYRVFPRDSTLPPSGHVPTRNNSPSDVAFDTRDSISNTLTFSTNVLSQSFSVLNSVTPGGIHASPFQHTGGNGPQSGQEVEIDVTFKSPFLLPGDHYFFVPQVQLNDDNNFLWLSAPKPIVAPGGTPINPDLQSWTRDAGLDPDWLRVGTDIVGGDTPPTFNAVFSLEGEGVPEPATLELEATGLVALGLLGALRRRSRQSPTEGRLR